MNLPYWTLALIPPLLGLACLLANGTLGRHHGHHQAAAPARHFPGARARRDPFGAQADNPDWPTQLHHVPCWEPVPPAAGPLPAAMQDEPAERPWEYETGQWPKIIAGMGEHDASAPG